MYTVKQVADYVGVSEGTIRLQWGKEFADYLSEAANPPKGQTRIYNDEDTAVLLTVALLRQQAKAYDDIHAELAKGTRLEPPAETWQPKPPPDSAETATDSAVSLETVQAFETALKSYDKRINRLEERLTEVTDRLIDAEARAAAAEARADLLQSLQTKSEKLVETPPQSPVEHSPDSPAATRRRSLAEWWEWFSGRE